MIRRILTEIWIYPVKSLGGIRVKSSRVMEKGLQYDRRWMLVDENNQFITQRNFPKMALFKLQFLDPPQSGFKVVLDQDSIVLPWAHPIIDVPVHAKVWDDDVTTFEVSDEHNRWFSERLETQCKLVGFREESPRPVESEYQINGEQVSLSDGYPLLIIGNASLDDLNARLKNPVPMNRFRPNLIFTGGDAYEEESWRYFTVGKNRFAGVKPCARCIITTTNQESGEQGVEPLATLAGYRKIENKVFFGQNVLAIDKDEIHEGEEIVLG